MYRKVFALLFFATPVVAMPSLARADDDAVQFFRNIEVTPDTPVHDAVCFFCSVDAEGRINGDTVVFFGDIRLNGDAKKDVVSFFGSVSAAEGSTIGGDLVSFFGSVRLGNNVRVHKDVVAMFGTVHAPPSVSFGHDRVVFSPWIFWGPLLVVFLVIYVIVHEVRVRRMRHFAAGYPMPPVPPGPPQR
jgi:hypothetical protein